MSEVQPVGLPAIFDGPSSNQIDQLAKALSAAQADMKPVPKDARNSFFGSQYSTLGAVIDASQQALGKHDLSILQRPSWVGDKLTMRTLLLHASGQWLDCGTMEATVVIPPPRPGKEARVNLLQAAGGIITYLRRYSRAAVCQLYSDEDTDGNGHAEPPDASQGALAGRSGEYLTEEPQESPPKTNQTRMKALNLLQAAPGQPQRALVARYLTEKKQLAVDAEPESWVLDYVPNTPRMLRELGAEIAKWQAEQGGAR